MTNNIVLELDALSLSHDGRAVCRHASDKGQQVIFVQGALPGQKVRARIIASKKSFAEAVCETVLCEAPNARTAACIHSRQCGGCTLQTMPYAQQCMWKERIVQEALCRIGKLEPSQIASLLRILPAPQEWGYRNKMAFTFSNDAQQNILLGLRAKASHCVTDIQQCLLLPHDCMPVLDAIRSTTRATHIPAWDMSTQQGLWRYAIIRRPHTLYKGAIQLLVHIITTPATKEQRNIITHMGTTLLGMGLGITGFVHEERKSLTEFAQGEKLICRMGMTQLLENIDTVQYAVPYNAFFQTNTAVAAMLCAEAEHMAALTGQENIWDLYCGVGAPGLNMAANAKQLYGAEINKIAIDAAKHTAQNLGFSHCHYVAKDVQKALGHWESPHVVLLDPPRAGVSPAVLQNILRACPQRIVYISCNPATLARDIALLTKTKEYILQKVVGVDMFPQTPHVETCALLCRTTVS